MTRSRRERPSHVILADAIGRREAIRRTAMLLGAALSASSVAGVLAGCGTGQASSEAWRARALDNDQLELVATIAEHIIPETDTPGARAAGVHRFVDTMLAEYYLPEERQRFVAGLEDADARARRRYGRPFESCDPVDQRAVLDELDREAFARPRHTRDLVGEPGRETERGVAGVSANEIADTGRRSDSRSAEAPFMRTMKELTVLGYYTSQAGATKELQYVRVPGRYDGCVPFTTVGRSWA